MLAKRIIPVLLTRSGQLVKGKQFNSQRVVGNAQQAAEIHQARGVDELLVLDVEASPSHRGPNIEAMRQLTECCFIPVAVGGGVTTLDHIRQLLANGADKVVIGTAAYDNPAFIRAAADRFGSQAITVAVDASVHAAKQGYMLMSRCGTQRAPFGDPVAFAVMMAECGAGELIVTNTDRDGMMTGYDTRLINCISREVDIPVVANGGCGSYAHMHQALKAGADAVAAGAMFQWLDLTPKGAAEYLARKGWETR